MTKSLLTLFVLLSALSSCLHAGSRGVALAFLDATTGERSKASLRLAELLEKDMREVYLNPELASAFPWNELDLELKVLDSKKAGMSFDRLLNTQDSKKFSALFENLDNPDGLVVFFHDAENGFARLKLFNWDGEEVLLIRMPLEGADSPMPGSLLKSHRHGALVALGAAVRWNP